MTAKAKLTPEMRDRIMARVATDPTVMNTTLAEEFGVDPSSISRVRRGKTFANGEGQMIEIGRIRHGNNPRQTMDLDFLAGLTASVQRHGILQALLLRPDPLKPGHYIIVAGHQRFEAAKNAALGTVPAIIREMDEWQALVYGLIENRDRNPLTPLEEAEAFVALQAQMTTAEMAEAFHCTPRHIQSRVRLRNILCEEGKEDLVAGNITLAQAEAVSAEPIEANQKALLRRCRSGELKTEADVRAQIQGKKPKKDFVSETAARIPDPAPESQEPAPAPVAIDGAAGSSSPEPAAPSAPAGDPALPPQQSDQVASASAEVATPAADDTPPGPEIPDEDPEPAPRRPLPPPAKMMTLQAHPDYPLWEALALDLAGFSREPDEDFPTAMCLWDPETGVYRLYEMVAGEGAGPKPGPGA